MRIRLKSGITLMFMLCLYTSSAQLDIGHFTKYNTLDGLNHNHITSITQDSIGFLWIGTEYGPMRFDGTSFVPLTALNPTYQDKELFTAKLTTLGKNEIGISTVYGAFVLNTSDYQYRNLQFDVEKDLTTWAYNIYDVGRDMDGYYGVSTKTGFYIFDHEGKLITSKQIFDAGEIGTSWMLYGRDIVLMPDGRMLQKNILGFNVFDPNKKLILENPVAYHLDTALMALDAEIHLTLIDSTTLVYYSTATKNLYLEDLRSGQELHYPVPIDVSNNLNWFSRIMIQNDSTLLLNGKTGVYIIRYNKKAQSLSLHPQLQLPDMEVTSLYTDREGRLWIGTYSGLYKENTYVPIERYDVSMPGKSGPLHIKWLEKGEGVWYASALQNRMLILDDQDYHIVGEKTFKYNEEILWLGKMLRFDEDHLWICSSQGILQYNTRTGAYGVIRFKNCPECMQNIILHEIYRDESGHIWVVGNEGNRVYKIKDAHSDVQVIELSAANPKFKVNSVYRFNEDGQGNIWFCGDAMVRYNTRLERVDSLVDKLPLQQNSRKVFLLYHTSTGELWITTNGENWHIYNDKTSYSMLEDPVLSPDLNRYQTMIDDVLYYISRQGKIVILNTRTRKSRILSAQDGWDQEMMVSFGFFKDPKTGYILFAGDNVIYRFQPEPSVSQNSRAPFISEINVFGKRVLHHPHGKLIFKQDEHTMQIKFLTLNYYDPSNQVYAYRLKGDDVANWIPIDQPEIILTQIPPGHYELELSVSSKNNNWPPVYQRYPITISFPVYRQWWFMVLVFGTIAIGAWLLIKYRMKQMRFISNLDRQVIEYELKALHAQMNPHFVFNCLNSIKEMIMSRDNRNANIYLNKFSYLLRATLDQSKLSFVPLSHTIEYLRHYLEMEKLRFSHFNYSIEVKEDLEADAIGMAPLLLQPIVENAIWHGQSTENNHSQLNLRFYVIGEDMVCEVEDFGVGINATKPVQKNGVHLSSALENIRKRIELLNRKHEVDYRLTIIDKAEIHTGQGTIVKLAFKPKHYEFD